MAANPNSLFGFPNLADVAPANGNFSGRTPAFLSSVGLWHPGAPLENLQNRFFANKARSVNCLQSSTQFVLDLGSPQSILAVVIPRHNLTLDAVLEVTLYSDAALTQVIGGKTVQVATQFAWGSQPFGGSSWFTGVIDPETAQYVPQPAMIIFDAPQIAQYVLVSITDPGNPAGYVELSRLFVTPGYQPSINIKYGAQMGINDPTIVTRSLGGADFDDERPIHRTFVGSIDYLPQDEAFASVFMMQLRLGKKAKGQFFFSMFPADPSLFALTSFVATLTKLDPLTAVAYNLQGVAFSIEEVVA